MVAEAQALSEWQCRCEPRDGLGYVGVVLGVVASATAKVTCPRAFMTGPW